MTKPIVIPLATLVHHLDACFDQLGHKEVFLNRRDWELIKANLRSADEPPALPDGLHCPTCECAEMNERMDALMPDAP